MRRGSDQVYCVRWELAGRGRYEEGEFVRREKKDARGRRSNACEFFAHLISNGRRERVRVEVWVDILEALLHHLQLVHIEGAVGVRVGKGKDL